MTLWFRNGNRFNSEGRRDKHRKPLVIARNEMYVNNNTTLSIIVHVFIHHDSLTLTDSEHAPTITRRDINVTGVVFHGYEGYFGKPKSSYSTTNPIYNNDSLPLGQLVRIIFNTRYRRF